MNIHQTAIYSIKDIRYIEQQHVQLNPRLMERAGKSAYQKLVELIGTAHGQILIVCGPGNNGGDGFVMARHFLSAKHPFILVFCGQADQLPQDARLAHDQFIQAGGAYLTTLPDLSSQTWDAVVDAMFGIGLSRPLSAPYDTWIEHLNQVDSLRIAIDIPSGLSAETGQRLGNSIFQATHTLSFLALKPGLLTNDAPDYCGQIIIDALGINPEETLAPSGRLVSKALFAPYLKPRYHNTHKGDYGEIGIIGGNTGMTGAALLNARAALKLGAGRVFLGLMGEQNLSIDITQPEIMLRDPEEVLQLSSVLAIGSGLGTGEQERFWLERCIQQDKPLIIDADGITLLAQHDALIKQLILRSAPVIVTPHPGEAAKILHQTNANIQADRIQAALSIAKLLHATVVLKGCGSIICSPDGRWFINTSGNAGLSAAGMGDVLTGIIASLIGQGWSAESALIGAVHLHGKAAERLTKKGIGPIGLTATELIDDCRQCLNTWSSDNNLS